VPELTKEQLLGEFIHSLINNTTKEFLLKQAGIQVSAGAQLTPAQIIAIAKVACQLVQILDVDVCPIIRNM